MLALLFLSLSGTLTVNGSAQETVVQDDIVLTADTVRRDSEDGPIIAEGDVRASSGGQFVRADRVTYDLGADTITAEGNVAVLDEDGQLYFSDRAVLTGDLRNAVVEAFAAELAPGGNLAAASVLRRESGTNTLRKATFTLCPICDEGFRADRPVWQLRAQKVTQDEKEKVLRFQNAFVEVYGVPVAYVPFLQMPDPSVERASGLMAPQIASSTRRGTEIEIPYYFAISPYQDFTFSPRHFSLLGTLLKGEWRRNTWNSEAIVQAGVINPTNDLSEEAGNPDDIRWHWLSRYRRGLPREWRFEADIDAVSDKGYFLTYDIEPAGALRDENPILRPDRLESNITLDRRTENSRTDISAWAFQTLRFNEDQSFTAQALPRLSHDQVFDVFGGDLTLGGSLLSLVREEGLDTLRASGHARYEAVKLTRNGHRFQTFAEFRADYYNYREADRGIQACNVEDRFYETCRADLPRRLEESSFSTQRFLPTVGAEWSYPLARIGERTSIIIEPRVQAVISPERDFTNDIFNEDSQFFQFDAVTLFDFDKSTGLDQWEDGRRINVGVRATASIGPDLTVNTLFGSQFREDSSSAFTDTDGIGEVQSDFVGAVDVRIGRNLTIDNRFRIDDDTGSFRSLESLLSARVGPFTGNLNYLRVESDEFEANNLLDEFLVFGASATITRNISIAARQAQNLDSGSTTNTEVALRLANRCTALSIRYRFDDSTIEGFEQDRQIFVRFDILGLN